MLLWQHDAGITNQDPCCEGVRYLSMQESARESGKCGVVEALLSKAFFLFG